MGAERNRVDGVAEVRGGLVSCEERDGTSDGAAAIKLEAVWSGASGARDAIIRGLEADGDGVIVTGRWVEGW